MKLFVNGVDIFEKVSVRYCIHEMHAADKADSLTVRFNDSNGIWSKWNPAIGTTIAFEHKTAKTGTMFIHSTKPENGCYTVRAYSLPISSKVKNSKSWSGVHFLQLGQEIANKNGLDFKNYGCSDRLYGFIAQENEGDFAFFWRLCKLEGYQMMVFNKSLIVYDEMHLENQSASKLVEVKEDGVFAYIDRTGESFGAAEVISGAYSGIFKIPNTKNNRILRPDEAIRVTSNAEATRYARGILRNANKNLATGTYSQELLPELAAGSVINLKTTKAQGWDGKIFITDIRNDYVGNTSTITFRKPLEGY